MTLAVRIALTACLMAAVATIGIGSVSFVASRNQILDNTRSGLAHQATIAASEIGGRLGGIVAIFRNLSKNTVVFNALIDSAGRETYLVPFFQGLSSVDGVALRLSLVDFQSALIAESGPTIANAEQQDWLIGAIEAGRSTARIFVENDEPHILLAEMLLYPRTDLIEGVLLMKFALGALLARANVHNGENYGFNLLHNGTGVGTSTGAATRISLHSTRTPCGYDSPLEVRKAIPTDNLLAPLGLSILVQEITGQTRDILLGLIGYYAAMGAAATAAPKTVSDSDTGALPRGNGELILVIEDDADLRSLTTGMIEGLGYRVIAVPEAASGLATLQREQVDMVLPDVVLPGGMSGPEFAKVAHERDPALKVAFMSGYA